MRLYEELDKHARKVVLILIMFGIGTYVLLKTDGFYAALFKGGILAAFVIPLVHRHYSDPTKYKFE